MRLGSILVVALAALLLAAAAHAYGLQLGGQCVSQLDYREHPWPDPLPPGGYSPLSYFTGADVIRLIIRANVSSNVPVKLAILKSWREIWATQPSTRIAGTYTVDLETPGDYAVGIGNPSSNTAGANFTGFVNITMCGRLAAKSWLEQYIILPIVGLGLNSINMGIASYGVMEVDGRYLIYNLTTDAVKGVAYIPPNISTSGYWENGTYYYGRAFSVLLGAFVVARLADGTAQYYWIRNIVGFDEKHEGLKVWGEIVNDTAELSVLGSAKGKGRINSFGNYYYRMPGTIPFGRVELEMRTRAADGKIIVEFYANGQKYDEVAITPYAPATSAYIVIAPATTSGNIPLNLMLVFSGYSNIDHTILNAGQIRLELYVRMNGAWVPPPSAWSVGSTMSDVFGYYIGNSSARVVPQGVGSALVVPGRPNPRQLWAGTVIATPLGINATNSTDLSSYARSLPELVNFGNGTRLILVAYINGSPAQLSSLSNVTLGSLVVLQYKRQYLVSISAPGNYTTGWFDEGSTIVIDEPPVVDLGNGTRLINPLINGTRPPLVVVVDRPLVVSYTRQYLVSLTSPINNTAVWANASSAVVLSLPPAVDFGNGTRLVEPRINGTRPPLVVEVNRPMSFVGTYVNKQYLVTYSGPTWLNRTWVNAGASAVFNPPQIIDLGNNTRLVNPSINGTKPPLSISVDKPLSLSVEYTRQYLVSVNTPFNKTAVWINAGASYAPPTISRNGIKLVPQESVVVNAPMNIDVRYNAYAEVPTTFLGLPALYAEASITCGGATNSTSGFFVSSLKLELIDVPSDKCSVSVNESVPSLALVAVAIIVVLAVILIRRRPSKT